MYPGLSTYVFIAIFLAGIALLYFMQRHRNGGIQPKGLFLSGGNQIALPGSDATWQLELSSMRLTLQYHSQGLEAGGESSDVVSRYVHPNDLVLLNSTIEQHMDNGGPMRLEVRIRHHAEDGWQWMELLGQAQGDRTRSVHYLHGIAWNIEERKRQELARLESDEKYRLIFHNMPVMAHMLDAGGLIHDVNPFWLSRTGYTREEVIGKRSYEFMEPASRAYLLEVHIPKLRETSVLDNVEIQWTTKSGEVMDSLVYTRVVRDDQGRMIHGFTVIRDITEHKKAEAKADNLIYHDILTGLPNRMMFHERLSFALIQANLYETGLAVVLIDLDRFKMINDSLGHQAGDQVLLHAAHILQKHIRPMDTVARLSSDEFALLLPDVSRPEDVFPLADKLLTELRKPFVLEKQEFYISASMGISFYPQDADNTDLLIKNADMAMYYAKEKGRNTAEVFHQEMTLKVSRKLQLESSMRRALERQEFRVFFQPQQDIATGRLFGMEALIRWESKEHGPISPAEFIPIAEESGLIVPIGQWILEESCRQTKQWMDRGFEPLSVSVNISGKQFQQRDFAATVKKVLEDTGLDPSYLCLEITESTAIHDAGATKAVLEELIEHGIRFSIDDFGTGYSSLSLLKLFPLYAIKIDQSFVRNMTNVEEDAAVVQAIIAMSHGMKRKVIAEGVETRQQLERLNAMGCDGYQGYFISRPVPMQEFEQMFLQSAR